MGGSLFRAALFHPEMFRTRTESMGAEDACAPVVVKQSEAVFLIVPGAGVSPLFSEGRDLVLSVRR